MQKFKCANLHNCKLYEICINPNGYHGSSHTSIACSPVPFENGWEIERIFLFGRCAESKRICNMHLWQRIFLAFAAIYGFDILAFITK